MLNKPYIEYGKIYNKGINLRKTLRTHFVRT